MLFSEPSSGTIKNGTGISGLNLTLRSGALAQEFIKNKPFATIKYFINLIITDSTVKVKTST
ncbi:MAG: hypothetical protein KAG06_00985 [Methylococcales bacterium]|nr:hypothetical protein [Methylococcales bacterium]